MEAYWQILTNFPFLDFMIITHTICPSHWSSKLNLCKILSLCAVIFTFWNYFRLIAFKEDGPLMTFWKFLILSIKYFQFIPKTGWLLGSFPASDDWISCDHRDALSFTWISYWLPDLLSVISCSEMWHFPQINIFIPLTDSSEKQVLSHYSLDP